MISVVERSKGAQHLTGGGSVAANEMAVVLGLQECGLHGVIMGLHLIHSVAFRQIPQG